MAKLMDKQEQDSIVKSVKPKPNWRQFFSWVNDNADFSNLNTDLKYDAEALSYLNRQLDSIPIHRRAPILASMIVESGADPTTVGDGGKAFGLFQWHPDRFNRYVDSANDIDYQARYAVGTLAGKQDKKSWHHGDHGSGFATAVDAQRAFYNGDLETANRALVYGYLRPNDKPKEVKRRLELARQILDRLKGNTDK